MGGCAGHLIDVDVKNCVACGSTQNTKVVNVIAKCGALEIFPNVEEKLKRKDEKLNKFTKNISNL